MAFLGDISCDSDGKVDQFIDRRDVKKTLRMHSFNHEPYYLGAFLLGAIRRYSATYTTYWGIPTQCM